jgi:hypothetical protein
MSITQDRMLALLTAGEAHRQVLVSQRATIQRLIDDPELSVAELKAMLIALVLEPGLPDGQVLAVERYHFRKFARANEKQRRRKAHARYLAGATPRATAPTCAPELAAQAPAQADSQAGLLAALTDPRTEGERKRDRGRIDQEVAEALAIQEALDRGEPVPGFPAGAQAPQTPATEYSSRSQGRAGRRA